MIVDLTKMEESLVAHYNQRKRYATSDLQRIRIQEALEHDQQLVRELRTVVMMLPKDLQDRIRKSEFTHTTKEPTNGNATEHPRTEG